jgi:PAS domain S-box-containing protein
MILELQAQQLELEKQNEKLRNSRTGENSGRERYADLYDFTPVGNFSLDRNGTILQINQASARLMGDEGARLLGRRFRSFVAESHRPAFDAFLTQVFGSQARQQCEVSLLKGEAGRLPVQIEAVLSPDGQGCHAVVTDLSGRNQAEAVRAEYLSMLQATIESCADGLLVVDSREKVTLLNSHFADLWRIPPALVERHDDRALLAYVRDQLAEPDAFLAKIRELYSRPEAESFDTLEFQDGRVYERYSRPQRREGQIVGRVWSFRDVTERKRMEEALRESKTKFESLIEMTHTGYVILDANGHVLDANQEYARLTGRSRSDIIGKSLADWTAPHDLARNAAEVKKCVERGSVRNLEVDYLGPDGQIHPIEVNATVLRSPQGISILTLCQDISERKRAARQLQASEARYRVLYESMRDALVIVDMDGRLQDTNSVFQTMLGYSDDELRRLSYIDLTPGKWHAVESKIVAEQILPWGYSEVYEKEYRRKDGTIFPVELQTVLIRDADGKPSAMWAIVRDITERKRAVAEQARLQAQLSQVQKMETVGRLAGGVAHDFNNMMGIVLGLTELALMDMDPGQPLFSDLQEIQKAAQSAADLTRQLLAFARKQTVEPKVLDLNETVEGLLKMLRRLIGEGIDLVWYSGAGLPPILMDPNQIGQVLVNLCVNARDAIAGVGRIHLKTEKIVVDNAVGADVADLIPGDYVLLVVSDTGSGMDAETLAHIFEPFFTTKGVGKGSGLGLATVYGIVKQNNGFIQVSSEPDQGTTFKIYLPTYQGKAVEVVAKGPPAQVRRGHETLLLVEDERALLELGKVTLEGLGYQVLAARTPGEALRWVEKHAAEIQLLVTDLILPEMNGRDLAMRILVFNPAIKCLFMSGYTADVMTSQGVLERDTHFIQKPCSRKALGDKVRMVLDT